MSAVSLDDPLVTAARRIVILGVTGSGKTHLASALGRCRGIPHHEMDAQAWQPGWVKTPDEELRQRAERIASADGWVVDALWTATRVAFLPRVELVIGLDYPWAISAGRLLGRTVNRLTTREPICGDNAESWRQTLSRDSILLWHLRTFRSKRRQILQWAADADLPPLLRLTHPDQAAALVAATKATS